LSLSPVIGNTLGQSALSFPDGGLSQLPAVSCVVLLLYCWRFAGRIESVPTGKLLQVPVAAIAWGVAVTSGGVAKSGMASRAPCMSCNRAWEYRPIVKTGVECRANSWAVLTDAPPATMPDMYVRCFRRGFH